MVLPFKMDTLSIITPIVTVVLVCACFVESRCVTVW